MQNVEVALMVAVFHTVTMLVSGGALAFGVYRIFGLRFITQSWFNLELFWAFSLIVLSIVAILGVHWPDDWNSLAELWKGYSVSDKGFGNYRIPLLFIAMLFPLMFTGAGRLSLDRLIARKLGS